MRRVAIAVSVALAIALLAHLLVLTHRAPSDRTIEIRAHRFAFTPHTIRAQQEELRSAHEQEPDVTAH